jgi:hypothetical protein
VIFLLAAVLVTILGLAALASAAIVPSVEPASPTRPGEAPPAWLAPRCRGPPGSRVPELARTTR